MSCIIGERPGEWIYSLRGVYAQVNIGCQDPLYLLTGPWPYQRSIFLFRRTAPSLWDIRPALRRFLGAYMEGKGGVTGLGLRILPVLVLSGTAFLVCAVRGASNWRMRLMGALVFHATILSAHPALDPKTPWWSSWGHPYAGYGLQASAWLRPVLWQFPDAYLIASVFTNSGGVSACITLVGAALLCHYGLEGRTRRRSLQAACFLGLIVLPILVVLSWWLMKAELDNERQYWERRNTLEKNAQSRAVWVIGSHLGMM
jgi:multisubunit Na+/H+ antiporter MnhG subunit